MTFFQLSLLSAFVIFSHPAKGENTTLLFVQTLSRHGDRAPRHFYPTDPNSADCWPNGLPQLTQLGKKQQYDVGKFFQSMYKDFVTPNPNQVFVNSSSQDRCLNSAAAQLASFFAPDERWKFAKDLDWQPIPVHYVPPEMDIYLNYGKNCPRIDDALNFEGVHEFYQQHQTMVEDVSNCSGLDFSDPSTAFHLHNTLDTERIHNLIIPEWAHKYWNDIKTVSQLYMQAHYSSPVQIRLRFGPFLGLLNNNMKNKMHGKTPDLKFVLNFAHDMQIAGILRALNFTNIPRPPYCATLLFELHEMADASKTVRLRYMNTTDPLDDIDQPHVLVLEGCSEFCPVEDFMKSYQWLIPDNRAEECQV